MSADHPLIGHAVRVSPGGPPGAFVPSFDGIVMDLLSEGILLVMRLDDGTARTWGAEYVTFSDPEHASHVLRAHAANTEAQGLGFVVTPEYAPPRWVPAKDVAVGTPYLAAVHQDGQTIADCDSGVPLTQDDRDAYVAMGLLILVGKWPPLPKEVEPEYTPPLWRHAQDCGVGMSVLAIAYPNDHVEMRPWGEPWFPEDAEQLADDGFADTTMLLVGKLPPLPKETT